MFRVAICDDEPVICAQIENIIMKYTEETNEKIETQVFYSGEELIRFLEIEQDFDLLFLDIEMELINGVEVGRRIREDLDDQVLKIVYVSGKDSYYRDLFDVRPMHFLHKPIHEAEIINDVRLAMKLADKLGGVFTYRKGREVFRMPVKNILYFESENREVRMITTEGTEFFYGKMDEIFSQVGKYHFLYIHKSYIVNYFFVAKFTYEAVIMSNKQTLPISQPRRRSTRELLSKLEKEGVL